MTDILKHPGQRRKLKVVTLPDGGGIDAVLMTCGELVDLAAEDGPSGTTVANQFDATLERLIEAKIAKAGAPAAAKKWRGRVPSS